MARRKKPVIPDDVLGQVLAGRVVGTMSDADALLGNMKKALAERLLNAELDHHLDGEAKGNRPAAVKYAAGKPRPSLRPSRTEPLNAALWDRSSDPRQSDASAISPPFLD